MPRARPVDGEMWFTTGEVAEMLHVSVQSILRWCNDGTIECQKTAGRVGPDGERVGGHRRILASAVRDYCKRVNVPIPPEAL